MPLKESGMNFNLAPDRQKHFRGTQPLATNIWAGDTESNSRDLSRLNKNLERFNIRAVTGKCQVSKTLESYVFFSAVTKNLND